MLNLLGLEKPKDQLHLGTRGLLQPWVLDGNQGPAACQSARESEPGARLGFHNLRARWGRAQLSEAATECEMENLVLALPPPLRKICRERRESLPRGNIPCLGDQVQEWLYFFGSKIISQSHARKMSWMQIFCSVSLHVSEAQTWHFVHRGCATNLLFFFFWTWVIKDLEHYKMSCFSDTIDNSKKVWI